MTQIKKAAIIAAFFEQLVFENKLWLVDNLYIVVVLIYRYTLSVNKIAKQHEKHRDNTISHFSHFSDGFTIESVKTALVFHTCLGNHVLELD